MDLWKALRIVRQRKWLFAVATMLALVAFAVSGDRTVVQPVYRSTAKVLLTPPSTPTGAEAAANGATLRTWFADPDLLKELLVSQELMGRVSARLGLPQGNRVSPELQPLAKAGGQVTLATISVTTKDPKLAQKYTATVVEEFITYVEELSAKEFSSTRQYLEDLVAEARTKVDDTENAILKWQEKNKAINVEQAMSEVASRVTALDGERTKLEQEVAGLNSELTQLRAYVNGEAGAAPWAVLSREKLALSGLEKNVADQRLKLADLRQTFTEENLQVKEQVQRLQAAEDLYRKELALVVESYLKEKQAALDRAQASLRTVQSNLADVRKKAEIGDERFKLARYQRQLSTWEETYNTLTTQLYRARVAEQGSRRQGAISVLEPPGPGIPTQPAVKPDNLRRLVLGFPFCLIFGFTVVLVLDYLTSSMRMRPRIEETLELPVLGSIPRLPADLAADWEEVKKGGRELVGVAAAVSAAEVEQGGNGHYSHGNGNGNGRHGHGHHGNGRNGHYGNGNGRNGNGNGNGRNGNGNGRHGNGNGKH